MAGEKINTMLAGVRILDLSRVMSGPFCTAMLADLGAEVIKIEAPGKGDDARAFGPFRDRESTYFMLLNRGKRSVTINLKSPEGVGLVKALAARCDVLIENFRPGVAARLGLDHEAIKARNERIIYASISGFGQESPLAKVPAFDHVIQAMSGLMSLTGERDGPPMAVGESIADVATGMFAAWAIMAALFERERSGKGRYLDVSMLDSVAAILLTAWSRKLFSGETPMRVGNRHPVTYPVDRFSTKDGDIVIIVPSDESFAALMAKIGRSELATDPRFQDNAARNANEAALREIISTWTAMLSSDEALAALAAIGVPSAPVWSVDDLLRSEHAHTSGLVAEGRHRRFGAIPLVPQPVKFSDTAPSPPPTAPMLGEHTDAVLESLLGLDDAARAALRKHGAI